MAKKKALLIVIASLCLSTAAFAQGGGMGTAPSGNGSPSAAPQGDPSTGPTRPAPQPGANPTTSSGQGGNNSPDRSGTSIDQPTTPRGSGAGSNANPGPN